MRLNVRVIAFVLAVFSSAATCVDTLAQENSTTYLSGSIQSDMLFPQADSVIGTGAVTDKFLSNTYLNLNFGSQYVDAGARLELLNKPLPGFEKEFAGAGIPNFYVTGKFKNNTLTVGNFYDQFGSGLIFRTYEERSLGIDNSLRGARLFLQPYSGIRFKLLGGVQRVYFNYDESNAWGFDFTQGAVWGSDLELNINEWVNYLQDNDWNVMLGASFVSKYQPKENIYRTLTQKLNLPENVAAGDIRLQLQKGNFGLLAEYALKANDPSADNEYIYKDGSALLLSGTYSRKGLSAMLQVKRSDNMAYRSIRTQRGSAAFINHLPAFTQTHTYALAALRPYATQPAGEWAIQGSFGYTFKKETPLGGKYGTTVKLNASYVCGLQKEYLKDLDGNNRLISGDPNPKYNIKGSDGYTAPFFGFGETYYTDINVELTKKISKSFSFNATYLFQQYNPRVIVSEPEDIVTSNIFIFEGKNHITDDFSLRYELQYLIASPYSGTEDPASPTYRKPIERTNQGDWIFGLVEASLFGNLMVFGQNMFNIGSTKLNYYNVGVTYNLGAHRIQVAYGRTRAGYNCSGGVCRYVPAFKGLQVSYNMTF